MAKDIKTKTRHAALKVTRWVGSVESIALHTAIFLVAFAAVWGGYLNVDRMLLILTTAVSLEAIYLAIFIQMTVNSANEAIEEVEQDIDEIQEDIDEIQEDVDELQEDVEEMSEDEREDERRKQEQKVTLEEIRRGLAKLAADVERLQKHP